MYGKSRRCHGGVVGFFPPSGELFVVDQGLRVKKVEAVVQESYGECVMVLLGPGMNVGRIFIHVIPFDKQRRRHNE